MLESNFMWTNIQVFTILFEPIWLDNCSRNQQKWKFTSSSSKEWSYVDKKNHFILRESNQLDILSLKQDKSKYLNQWGKSFQYMVLFFLRSAQLWNQGYQIWNQGYWIDKIWELLSVSAVEWWNKIQKQLKIWYLKIYPQ